MRDYSKVAPQFWTGETGKLIRLMGRDAQVVGFYLMTCPSSNMLGLYYLPLPTLCHETASPLKGALKALRSLSEGGFAHYDEQSETVFVPQMARFQIGHRLQRKDNRWKAVVRELEALRNSPFFMDFIEIYRDNFELPVDELTKGLRSPLEGPSKPGAGAGAGAGARTEIETLRGSRAELHETIIATYHELLPELPRVKDWNERRSRKLDARIRERIAEGKPADQPDYWRKLLQKAAESDLLCGRKTDWRADLEWLLEPKHFTKLIEGGYDNVVRLAS